MKTTKRKFTTEFKEEAVRLVVREGLSTPEAARRIEISDKTLANWGRLARHGFLFASCPPGACDEQLANEARTAFRDGRCFLMLPAPPGDAGSRFCLKTKRRGLEKTYAHLPDTWEATDKY